MIAAKEFYCMQEKKRYKMGDVYTGNRKDLGNFLKEAPKKKKATKRKKK